MGLFFDWVVSFVAIFSSKEDVFNKDRNRRGNNQHRHYNVIHVLINIYQDDLIIVVESSTNDTRN